MFQEVSPFLSMYLVSVCHKYLENHKEYENLIWYLS